MNDRSPADIEAWAAWEQQARQTEPCFLAAIDHHEHTLNRPGIEIIANTEPRQA